MWKAKGTSDALTLGAAYATVQEAAADKVWTLTPGELATLILDVDFQTTPTEDADILIVRSVDGTEFESDGEAERHIVSMANREGDDPAERHVSIGGCYAFKVRARVRDPDDTVGGDDNGSTLTVHYRLDGIDL